MQAVSKARQIRPFHLMRWFSLTALISVALVSILAAWMFSSFLTDRMIRQEAEITAGFVRNVVATENAYGYFDGTHDGKAFQLQDFLDHLTRMPEVLRANIYSADRRVLWSSDPSIIGQPLNRNEELEEALLADLVIHSGIIDPTKLLKAEHQHLSKGNRFIESYIPIFDVHGRKVVGVVELYKVPSELFEAIRASVMLIWLVSAVAGLFLYSALFWIVRRAHRIIEEQRDMLLESESLVLAGEMGSAIATRLSNPLASIRSLTEKSLKSALPPEAIKRSHEIVTEVDRMESWAHLLLICAKPPEANLSAVDINAILLESLSSFAPALDRRGIAVRQALAENLPAISADAATMTLLIDNLIANMIEAMAAGGELTVGTASDSAGFVFATIQDYGSEMVPVDMIQALSPFFTKNAKGLGLGLPLVRRVVEHLGGNVVIDSAFKGTAIRLHFPVWSH